MAKEKLIEMGDVFTVAGLAKINVGEILTFRKDGRKQEYKVVKRNLNRHSLKVRECHTYAPDEIKVVDKPAK